MLIYPLHSCLNTLVLSHKECFFWYIHRETHILQGFCIRLINFITNWELNYLRLFFQAWNFDSWYVIWFIPWKVVRLIGTFLICSKQGWLTWFFSRLPDFSLHDVSRCFIGYLDFGFIEFSGKCFWQIDDFLIADHYEHIETFLTESFKWLHHCDKDKIFSTSFITCLPFLHLRIGHDIRFCFFFSFFSFSWLIFRFTRLRRFNHD